MGDKASGVLVLISAALLCAVLGSIHAFSVFLDPLQQAFGLSRATVSLTYSFGLLAITLAVLLGPRFYSITTPARLFAIVGLLGAFGAVLAGIAGGIAGIWVGYSLCFGIANGMGYGFALQYSARANPLRPGLAMGTVTAAYALGAALAPLLFVKALAAGGFGAAMTVLAAALLLAAGGAAMAVARSGIPYGERTEATTITLPPAPAIIRIWLAYGTGVAAGLMAIGHAAGFAALAGIAPWLAPAVLALCNMAGSLTGGYLADRFSAPVVLSALPVLSIAGLLTLAQAPVLTLLALGILGFAYGGTIAAYPAVIARRFPGAAGPVVYGRVFTAWGLAGLLAPWIAGLLYDQNQSYLSALWIAATLATASALLART